MASKGPRRKRWRSFKPKEASDIFAKQKLRATRKRIVSILRTDKQLAKGAENMATCGASPIALRLGPDGCSAIYPRQCRELLCPFCTKFRAAKRRSGLLGVIEELDAQGKRLTLMTLTLRHGAGDTLKSQLGVLSKACTRFRKTTFFDKHFNGWARGFEVTWGADNGFHAHVHYIVDARFVNLKELHKNWAKCVVKAGGTPPLLNGVDLKGLERGKGLNEAVGYPFKVAGLAEWPKDKIIELAKYGKHKRFYQACQNWSKRIKEREREAKVLAELEGLSVVVRFATFVDDVRQGDPEACAAAPSVLRLLAAAEGMESAARLLFDVMPDDLRRSWVPVQPVAECHDSG